MAENNVEQFLFEGIFPKPVLAMFDAAGRSSNAGLALFSALDQRLGLTKALAGCLEDRRCPSRIVHGIGVLLQQRIFSIALGCADANDAAQLGRDPALMSACGRRTDDTRGLGSQPTLSRFEHGITGRELVDLEHTLEDFVVERLRRSHPCARRIYIDLDPTVDPTHGQQPFSFFNGHYDRWCYLPMMGFLTVEGEPEQHLFHARLRAGTVKEVKLPMDVQVSPYGSCEREHLIEMLPSLEMGDVLVLDRGFPSHEVFQALSRAEVDYLVRVPATQTFSIIDELRESGGRDRAFCMEPPEKSPRDWRPLHLRAVRITAPDGADSFFITSLRRSEFSRKQLGELYHMRWEVEEFYKLLKGPYIGQGQFRSRSPSGVLQEVHALVLFLAIARLCMGAAATVTGCDYESLSQKAAVLGLAAYLTRILLLSDRSEALRELQALLQRIVTTREKKRPGRAYPRVSFRPSRRWGPKGRRRGD